MQLPNCRPTRRRWGHAEVFVPEVTCPAHRAQSGTANAAQAVAIAGRSGAAVRLQKGGGLYLKLPDAVNRWFGLRLNDPPDGDRR